MKNKKLQNEEEKEQEILKAVAQAWLGHSSGGARSTSTSTNEFDAYRNNNYKGKATRFKLEAMNKLSKEVATDSKWDFKQSLWDSYEIVTVAKKLEAGMVLDHPLSIAEDSSRVVKKRKESKHSLRSLLSKKIFDTSSK
ncbi:hypothetical protein FRX31_024598 [Thalictrum thalictroides]|uniref:Uncharacterized protein n=1 Tax=Thalictrum thalictroides TaxID=46969 RepID=A0A7J6VNP3_THATH|nr:hypothetical protein FRX31_024598 [Thalictrum thalictroides]